MANAQIDASDSVRSFIARRGGDVYIWIDSAGIKRVSTKPPQKAREFRSIRARGLVVHEDAAIAPPQRWEPVLRRVPWKRLDALYNGEEGPGVPGAGSWTDGALHA